MPNLEVNDAVVAKTLTATLYQDEVLLEVTGPDDQTLVSCVGVEDEEDARARLRTMIGALADAVTVVVK